MNMADIILVILIGIAVFFALRTSLRRRKNGSTCCGDCSRCGMAGGQSVPKKSCESGRRGNT